MSSVEKRLPVPLDIVPELRIRFRHTGRIVNLQIPSFRSEDGEAHCDAVIVMRLNRDDRLVASGMELRDMEIIGAFVGFHTNLVKLMRGYADTVAFLDSQRSQASDPCTAGNKRSDARSRSVRCRACSPCSPLPAEVVVARLAGPVTVVVSSSRLTVAPSISQISRNR